MKRHLTQYYSAVPAIRDVSFTLRRRVRARNSSNEGHRDVLLGAYRDALNRGSELLRQYEAATGEALASHIENVAPPVGPRGEQVRLILETID